MACAVSNTYGLTRREELNCYYTFTVRVNDGHGGEDTQTWTVHVGDTFAGNHSPIITSTPLSEGYAGLPYAYQLTATDPDGDQLTYYLEGTPPEGMMIDPKSGILGTVRSMASTRSPFA